MTALVELVSVTLVLTCVTALLTVYHITTPVSSHKVACYTSYNFRQLSAAVYRYNSQVMSSVYMAKISDANCIMLILPYTDKGLLGGERF